jgi:hypothetical protein
VFTQPAYTLAGYNTQQLSLWTHTVKFNFKYSKGNHLEAISAIPKWIESTDARSSLKENQVELCKH